MLRGGGKAAAESASEERNVGQGNATDAGGVETKIETVRPAAEGRFDWKQAGMTEKEYMDVAKSADAMYDIGSETENIRAYLRDQPLCQRIQSGEMATQLEMGQFRKHVPGTNEYKQYVEKMHRKGWYGPSRLSISQEEAQLLIDRYRRRQEVWLITRQVSKQNLRYSKFIMTVGERILFRIIRVRKEEKDYNELYDGGSFCVYGFGACCKSH